MQRSTKFWRLMAEQLVAPSDTLATFDHPNSPTSLFVKLPLLRRLPSLAGLGPKYSRAKKRERIQASLGGIGDCAMRDLAGLFPDPARGALRT
jgi:hypothetical protein